ncbi:MAG: helix-turn-helix transcriptional regulator [Frankiaceae bacterium]|nr:helix-turn-helix transcriptional regulator [Frankiaceae bacterium]
MTAPVLDPLLAATRECVMDVGLKRTTLADVARRAGVSRMTVYRQYGDLQTIVNKLLECELLALLADARDEVAGLPTARERLVEAAVRTVAALAHHPLYRRVLDLDPELLLPLVVDRFGSTQKAAIDLVAVQVAEGQQDGSVRAVDPRTAAICMQLTAQSFVFSARVVEGQPVGDELRHLLDAYLRPVSAAA